MVALAIATALGALEAGCPEPPAGPRWTGAGAERPRRGGTFVFHHESDVRGFDPHVSFDELSNMGIKLLFEGLLDYDREGHLIPRLAEAMPIVSEDGRTFSFTLRRGVRFHNGRELTAEDERWSLEHMLDPHTNSPGLTFYALIDGVDDFQAGRARHIRGISVRDRYRLDITLKQPDQTFLYAMAMPFSYPVPRENYARWGTNISRHPVGTGAFMLEEWEQGLRVVFRRNPRFFIAGQPYVDRMIFEVNLSRVPAFMRFRNGDIDHVHRFAPADYLFIKEARAWAPYRIEEPVIDLWGIVMNCEIPPFDNVHVRRAVAFAIDRRRWKRARANRLRPTGQPVPPGLLGYDENLPGVQRFDLAKARQEMRLAGHPRGLDEEVVLWTGEASTSRFYGELAQSDLAKIGMRVRLRQTSFPVFLTETGTRHRVQMHIGGWSQDFPDPADFLDILFHSRAIRPTGAENRSFYNNPELDRLLDQARVERDRARRHEIYRQAQQIVVRDAPWAFVWNDLKMEAWQPYVKGYRPHRVFDEMYRDLWLDLPRRRIAQWLSGPRARGLAAALGLGLGLPMGGSR